jgi:hypothetical protein
MSERPTFLETGQRARMFPVLAETSKEGRTLSIFLSCLCAVDELGRSLLASVGKKVGKTARIEPFTEIVFKSKGGECKVRPDGIIIVTTGKNRWSAIVEAKVGNAKLDPGQIEEYAKLARDHGVDAVITISNQFATLPEHHPVKLPKLLTKRVGLFHWSWMYVMTVATLLLSDGDVTDADQKNILREFLRFLNHPSSGVSSFDQMNAEWKDLVATVKSGSNIAKSNPMIESTVASWHQEVRDLCLILSRRIGCEVRVKLRWAHVIDPRRRLMDDCEQLSQSKALECELIVPDAASNLKIKADLQTRCVNVWMNLQAPGDKQSTKAKLNWILRQLSRTDDPDVHLRANWAGQAVSTQALLGTLKSTPEAIEHTRKGIVPRSFDILLVRDMAGKFSGRGTFILGLEEAVPAFYEQVGQYLKAWHPRPPKIKGDDEVVNGTQIEVKSD